MKGIKTKIKKKKGGNYKEKKRFKKGKEKPQTWLSALPTPHPQSMAQSQGGSLGPKPCPAAPHGDGLAGVPPTPWGCPPICARGEGRPRGGAAPGWAMAGPPLVLGGLGSLGTERAETGTKPRRRNCLTCSGCSRVRLCGCA